MVICLHFEPDELVHSTMVNHVARIALSSLSAILDISPQLLHHDEMRRGRQLGARIHRQIAHGKGIENVYNS